MGDFSIIIISILFAVIGFFLGTYFSKLKTKSEKSTLEERLNQLQIASQTLKESLEKAESSREEIRREKELLNSELIRKNADFENLKQKNEEQKTEVEKLQEKFTKEFENLANKILKENSSNFKKESKEGIETILNPLKEKIKEFEKKVEDTHKENFGLHKALNTQLENIKKLNLEMTKEATNLTKALKGDNKKQGNWGELVLENVLQKSGLTKDIDYYIQQSSINDENTRQIPDVIINLPDGKKMIIDSKVSLKHYEEYSSSENEIEREVLLKKHTKSLKDHITLLSHKKYEKIYETESPDFVLMFVPIEPALYLAQYSDDNFFYTAFSNNILLVSQTTLLATLKMVDNLWKNERQQKNAVEIARHAASLYGKFQNLLVDLETVGNRINSTGTAYQSAMKKLTGNQNLIKDIDKLEKLGVSPTKKIEQKWLDKANVDNDEDRKSLP